MKLTLEHSVLAPIVADLAAVARGPSPAARAIRITIKDGHATFASSDGECWLERKIACDAKPGTIAVDAPILHAIVAGGFGPITLDATDRLTIRYGSGKYRLPLIEPGDTAFMPKMQGEPFLLPAAEFKAALKALLPAVSDPKDAKLYKHGIHMLAVGDKIRFTGGDGNRIAVAEIDGVSVGLQDKGVITPPGACKSLLRLVEDGSISIRASGNLIQFDYADPDGDLLLTSKLIDDDYPLQIVERFTKMPMAHVIEVPAADVLAAVNRLMPLADQAGMRGGRAMHFRALDGDIKLSVVSDAGAAAEALQAETPKAISFGFNAISLKMALVSGGGVVRFEFAEDFANQPCRLTLSDAPSRVWLLCAVRVAEPMLAEAA